MVGYRRIVSRVRPVLVSRSGAEGLRSNHRKFDLQASPASGSAVA